MISGAKFFQQEQTEMIDDVVFYICSSIEFGGVAIDVALMEAEGGVRWRGRFEVRNVTMWLCTIACN